jgi:hypothetical protein
LREADPAQVLAHQHRPNFRSAFSAFQFVLIREIQVKPFASFLPETQCAVVRVDLNSVSGF